MKKCKTSSSDVRGRVKKPIPEKRKKMREEKAIRKLGSCIHSKREKCADSARHPRGMEETTRSKSKSLLDFF